eukprot:6199636-Pleurochrysis_carterae.AAC.2
MQRLAAPENRQMALESLVAWRHSIVAKLLAIRQSKLLRVAAWRHSIEDPGAECFATALRRNGALSTLELNGNSCQCTARTSARL